MPGGDPSAGTARAATGPRRLPARARPGAPRAVARFAERVADYRADRALPGRRRRARRAIADACARHGARRVVAPAGLPAGWRVAGSSVLATTRRPAARARSTPLDGVLTGAAVAIAETGTIVLDGGAGQGRRALSLLPDLHVCVVARATRSSPDVPRAMRRCAAPSTAAGR